IGGAAADVAAGIAAAGADFQTVRESGRTGRARPEGDEGLVVEVHQRRHQPVADGAGAGRVLVVGGDVRGRAATLGDQVLRAALHPAGRSRRLAVVLQDPAVADQGVDVLEALLQHDGHAAAVHAGAALEVVREDAVVDATLGLAGLHAHVVHVPAVGTDRLVGTQAPAEAHRLAGPRVQVDDVLLPLARVAAPGAHVGQRVVVRGREDGVIGPVQDGAAGDLRPRAAVVAGDLQDAAVPAAAARGALQL